LTENKDISITNIQDVKTITKPWGYEKLIADGSPDFKYALKEILIRSNYSSSIQFHEFKQETTYVKSGNGWLYYNEDPIDFTLYNDGKYSKNDLKNIIKNMKKLKLESGVIYHIKPGIVHRVESSEDLIFVESSTVELDDVHRLNDQWGRSDGKIAKEHLEYFEIYKNDIFKEQNNRYNFTKTYSTGKVLDVTMGKFMAYHGAQILLKNGATEVWNNDFLDNNTSCFIRKFNDDKTICFMKIEKNDDEKFDVILSNQIIQYEKEAQKTIERYVNSLSKNGILIISTYNSKNKLYKNDKTDSRKINGFTKNDFQNLLENHFEKVSIFSQRNITTSDLIGKNTKEISIIKDDLRSSLGKMLLRFDKKSIFYKKYLQDSISRIDKSAEKFSDGASDIDYKPSEFKESDNPLFFIAVCKK
jgi:2-polyprenyl-3-methyl-5-hydroxy-6-metoxy-1,4-benzoquinol methylase